MNVRKHFQCCRGLRGEPPSSPFPSARAFFSAVALAVFLLSVSPLLAQHAPPAEGRTLDGVRVDLATVLKQQPAFLVLGFSQKSADDARLWSKALHHAETDEGRDDVYDIILLERVPRLLRGFVEGQIRKDMSPSVRSHFISLTSNEKEWRDFAHVTSPDDVYVLALDEGGNVCWQAHGPLSEKELTAAENALHHAMAASVSANAAERSSKSSLSGPASEADTRQRRRDGGAR